MDLGNFYNPEPATILVYAVGTACFMVAAYHLVQCLSPDAGGKNKQFWRHFRYFLLFGLCFLIMINAGLDDNNAYRASGMVTVPLYDLLFVGAAVAATLGVLIRLLIRKRWQLLCPWLLVVAAGSGAFAWTGSQLRNGAMNGFLLAVSCSWLAVWICAALAVISAVVSVIIMLRRRSDSTRP